MSRFIRGIHGDILKRCSGHPWMARINRAMTDGLGYASMTHLCSLDDLNDPGTREFRVDREGRLQSVFLVRKGDEVFGYLNACPHAGQPLNRMRSRFLNLSETHLFCSAHAATFEIETGLCLGGPCAGKSLTRIAIRREGDEIFLG